MAPTIDSLLVQVPDSPATVLDQLQSHPELASEQDAHGYSLLHAAASYGHEALLKALVRDHHVDPNIKDEDGETALFSVEEVRMAKELIELGTDISLKNSDGQTAVEKLDDEDEQPAVAAYLRQLLAGSAVNGHTTELEEGDLPRVSAPTPLPMGMQLTLGTTVEAGDEPDPEFRRRIEELAARSDFQREEGQRELRELVTEAMSGLVNDNQAPPSSRRRLN